MAITNGWGQGVINNTIEWGKGSNNATNDWGAIYGSSASGDTALEVSTPSFSNTKSVDFDGVDDYVDLGNPSNLNFDADNAFSFSVWFKRPSNANTMAIVSKQLGSPNYTGLQMWVNSDKVNFRIRENGSRFHMIKSNTTHPINTWVHYVVTYDGSRTGSGLGLNLYEDGVKLINVQKSGNFATGSCITSVNLGIGSRIATSDLYFDGNIDELSVFNSELSASNVSTIYNSGTPNDISALNPLSWWRMGDNDTFPTLTDNGSGGNNGTMTNMVSGDIETDTP
jgi:hypothetical protein